VSQHSAGILLYRFHDDALYVLLVHPGGPFWVGKDLGAWSIPKGLLERDETPLETAKREFTEETGFKVDGDFIELGKLKQPSGKIVHAWALEGNIDASKITSNTFTLEWPRNSGRIQEYPEVEKGEWFDLATARKKMHKGQVRFLDKLIASLKS
jgi:predicted NUDIX family NTP pyrophosphohydrolase